MCLKSVIVMACARAMFFISILFVHATLDKFILMAGASGHFNQLRQCFGFFW